MFLTDNLLDILDCGIDTKMVKKNEMFTTLNFGFYSLIQKINYDYNTTSYRNTFQQVNSIKRVLEI